MRAATRTRVGGRRRSTMAGLLARGFGTSAPAFATTRPRAGSGIRNAHDPGTEVGIDVHAQLRARCDRLHRHDRRGDRQPTGQSRPRPARGTVDAQQAVAERIVAALGVRGHRRGRRQIPSIWARSSVGFAARTRAAPAVTKAAAMEVPSSRPHPPPTSVVEHALTGRHEIDEVPSAREAGGAQAPSDVETRYPRVGSGIDRRAALLPPVPRGGHHRDALLEGIAGWRRPGRRSRSGRLSDRSITWAPAATAVRMPRAVRLWSPSPSAARTRIGRIRTSLATPAIPAPSIPRRYPGQRCRGRRGRRARRPSSTRSATGSRRPVKSGMVSSMPESRTATVTPRPRGSPDAPPRRWPEAPLRGAQSLRPAGWTGSRGARRGADVGGGRAVVGGDPDAADVPAATPAPDAGTAESATSRVSPAMLAPVAARILTPRSYTGCPNASPKWLRPGSRGCGDLRRGRPPGPSAGAGRLQSAQRLGDVDLALEDLAVGGSVGVWR